MHCSRKSLVFRILQKLIKKCFRLRCIGIFWREKKREDLITVVRSHLFISNNKSIFYKHLNPYYLLGVRREQLVHKDIDGAN
jgi:hypothetical protein